MENFNIRLVNENELSNLGLNQDTLNVINATIAPEFAKCLQIIDKYNSKKQELLKIYNNENDVRIMFFTKILNTLYSYLLERVLINGLVDSDEDTKDYLKRIGLSAVINNWDTFKFSHNFYNAFTCYIKIFSCLESSLREIHFHMGLNPNKEYKTFYKIYHPIIEENNLNSSYEDLLELLAKIRNLVHNMGVSNDTKDITYKNTTYKFEKDQIPKPEVVNLINLFDLFENDIIDFVSDLFSSNKIKQIANMPDYLSSEFESFEKWLANN